MGHYKLSNVNNIDIIVEICEAYFSMLRVVNRNNKSAYKTIFLLEGNKESTVDYEHAKFLVSIHKLLIYKKKNNQIYVS